MTEGYRESVKSFRLASVKPNRWLIESMALPSLARFERFYSVLVEDLDRFPYSAV